VLKFKRKFRRQRVKHVTDSVSELTEDGTDVPKHEVAVKDCTDVFVTCALVWCDTDTWGS